MICEDNISSMRFSESVSEWLLCADVSVDLYEHIIRTLSVVRILLCVCRARLNFRNA